MTDRKILDVKIPNLVFKEAEMNSTQCLFLIVTFSDIMSPAVILQQVHGCFSTQPLL